MRDTIELPNLEATAGLASKLSARPEQLAGQVVYLQGDLGAGKTTLVRYWLQALGYSGRIKSPTYGLMETYTIGELKVIHLDCYRLSDPEELEYLGLRDLYSQQVLMLIEWPDYGTGYLPVADLQITLSDDSHQRYARIDCLKPDSALCSLLRNQMR